MYESYEPEANLKNFALRFWQRLYTQIVCSCFGGVFWAWSSKSPYSLWVWVVQCVRGALGSAKTTSEWIRACRLYESYEPETNGETFCVNISERCCTLDFCICISYGRFGGRGLPGTLVFWVQLGTAFGHSLGAFRCHVWFGRWIVDGTCLLNSFISIRASSTVNIARIEELSTPFDASAINAKTKQARTNV